MTYASSLATLPTPTSFIPEENADLSNAISRLADRTRFAPAKSVTPKCEP